MFVYDYDKGRLDASAEAVEHLMERAVKFIGRAHGFTYDNMARAQYIDTYVNAGVRLLTNKA